MTETHIKDNEQRLEIYSSLFEQRGFILKLFDKFIGFLCGFLPGYIAPMRQNRVMNASNNSYSYLEYMIEMNCL